MAVLPAPITSTRRPTSHSVNGFVCVWKMKSSASQTPGRSSPSMPSGSVCPRPTPRKTASNSVSSFFSAVGRDALVEPQVDADLANQFDFGQREFGRNLVGRDAERVQPAGHVAGLEDDDVVAAFAQFVGTGQPGRAGADDGDLLAGRRPGREELDALGRGRVAWRGAAAGRSAPATSAACYRRRPLRRAPRSGRRGRRLPPKILASRIVLAAPMSFLCMICRMNFGMSMCVGQARVQGASKQYRQRAASTSASSGVSGGGRSANRSRSISRLYRSPALA